VAEAPRAPAPDPAPTAGDEEAAPAPAEDEPAAALTAPPVEPPPPPDEGVPGLRIGLHDPTGRALARFHASLAEAQAGTGQSRVLFYGASHVASDLFTGLVRAELQSRFGDGGSGFALPAKPWRYYNLQGIEIDATPRAWTPLRVRASHRVLDWYGLAGVAVETRRAGAVAAIETAASGRVGRTASRYDLHYLEQEGGGDFDVYIDGRRIERVRTAADAHGPGYATYHVEDGPHRFELRVRGNGPVRVFGVAVERSEPGVIVDTLGINGARAEYHLLWEDALYREHLARRDPDLVVLAYGTNEVGDDDDPIEEYEARMNRVMTRVRETVPNASCLLIGPSDRPMREEGEMLDRPRTRELIAAQRRVSDAHGCAFFDMVAFMGGPLSMVSWVEHEPPYGAPDHIHLTRLGYERLGVVLLDAMLRGYEPPAVPEPAPAAPIAERPAMGDTASN
jgi:lysophospholipase L1-like esterase